MKTVAIFYSEIRSNFVWHITWLITLASLLLLLIGIYPGDNGMKDLLPLLQTASVEDLLGNFGSPTPGYSLWISFMIPFVTILLLIYSMTTGVRTVVQSVSDGTGELLHTLPVSRASHFFIRFISNLLPLVVYFIIQALIFSIPISGHTISLDYLFNIGLWGFLFTFFGLTFGMLFGLLAGNASKGHQFSLIFVLFLYALQIVSNSSKNLTYLTDYNPLSYFQPQQYLLGKGFVKNGSFFGFTYYYYPILLIVLSLIFLILGYLEFNRKDLTIDAGFHLNILKRFSLKASKNIPKIDKEILNFIFFPLIFLKNVLFPKNVRNNPFVFWARIFENKLPITSDFIYSDNMLLFIASLGIFLFFPLQFLVYPGDSTMMKTAAGFSSSLFLIFTYGHNLLTPVQLSSDPKIIYLWYIISNSIGVIWVVLVPLSYFWVRRAIRNDGNSGTGEIPGGIPLKSMNVVFQRILAIIIELVLLILMMVFWLLLCEAILGETYNQYWEILSLFCMIPLYIFLITFSVLLTLFFKQRGGLLTGVFLGVEVLSFIISILNQQLNTWYMRGIIDLYDPVLIIQDKSLTTNNYGLIILSVLSIISFIIIFFNTSKFTWLNITNKSKNPNS